MPSRVAWRAPQTHRVVVRTDVDKTSVAPQIIDPVRIGAGHFRAREIMPVDLFHRSRLAPTTATILVVADQFLKVAPSLAPTATYSLPPFINTTGMDARVPGAVNESLTASVLPSKATTEFEYPWASR